MTYYGFLHRDSKELTDISASVPVGRELEGDVVELDSMPDCRPGTPLTYDAANRAAIPHEDLILQRKRERETRLAMEASSEWRDMADVAISEVSEGATRELVFPDRIAPELVPRMEGRRLIDIPTEGIVRELVKVAYFASLNPEESKLYPFTIAFLSTDGSPYWLAQRGWVPIAFKEPRPFSADEITKLAPALDVSQTAICVRQGEHGGLEIWGVVITSRSVHKFREGSPPGFFWMGPRHLRIRVAQPGRLVFDDGITWLLEYRLGEVVKDLLPVFREDGPVFRFLQSFKCANERSMPIRYPFALLAQRVLNMGHGGMIILVKDEEADEAINALNVKYQQIHPSNYVWSLVQRFELDEASRRVE